MPPKGQTRTEAIYGLDDKILLLLLLTIKRRNCDPKGKVAIVEGDKRQLDKSATIHSHYHECMQIAQREATDTKC